MDESGSGLFHYEGICYDWLLTFTGLLAETGKF
jgi:hypothetical protein